MEATRWPNRDTVGAFPAVRPLALPLDSRDGYLVPPSRIGNISQEDGATAAMRVPSADQVTEDQRLVGEGVWIQVAPELVETPIGYRPVYETGLAARRVAPSAEQARISP